MMRYVLSCLLLGILAWGQATKPTSSPPALAASSQPADATNADGSSAPDSRIGPDVAVITVNGLCEASHAGSDSKDCVTVITRAQFEKLVADIQPDMSLPSQRQFAARYAETLILAQKAHEMGIDQGQEFDEHMEIARVSILSEALSDALHEKAQISEKEIEDYYHRHLADYEEANVQRMFVPRIQQLPTLKEKLTEEQQRARKQESENAMKAEAEKLRARAVAGENFNTLQDEAFELAGIHAGPSNASLGEMRRSQMPANQAFVMDLKPGEVSSIITDPSGYIVYRVDSKTTEPLSQVHSDIRDVLVGQRVQEQLKSLLEAANPVLDERYFGPEKP
jgi:hypothetical protein